MRGMRTLRFGIVSTTATYWAHYLAEAQGLYRAHGVRVETVVTGSTRAAVDALASGDVDLAGCSPDEVFSAVDRGDADLVVIGGIVNRPVSHVVARPGITSVQAVRGRRVGVNQARGSVSMVLRGALRRGGLEDDAYEQVRIGSTPAMARAVVDGAVDVAMLTAPYDWDLTQRGFNSLLNVGEVFPEYAFTTLNARRSSLEETGDSIRSFMAATREATARLFDAAHREHGLQALGRATGLTGDALERSHAAYTRPGVLAGDATVSKGALAAVITLMEEERLVRQPPRVDALLVPR